MNSFVILGAVVLLALVAFKIFGKLLKIAVVLAVAAAAVIYFAGGTQIGGVTVPSFHAKSAS